MPTRPSPAQRLSAALVSARRWVVLAMLLTLHAALVSVPGGDFQRIWLMVHFGLFLLWQPFYAAERELEVFSVVLLVAITAAILWFLSGWMIVMWLSLLLGILGGKVFTVHAARFGRFYLVAFTYLLTILLLWVVPALLLPGQPIPEPVRVFTGAILPLAFALLAFLPFGAQEEAGQVFDFFYAVLLFQLVVVLVLGSVALMRYTDDQYFRSVALTVLGFGAALFLFAVLWSPRGGFGGLRIYFSRYLLSVGMPFERWVRRVAELAEREGEPRRFLEQALAEIAAFPWMRGGEWQSADGDGAFGQADGHASRFSFHGLDLTFYSAIALSPALFLHMRLLAQVVGEFYEGKRRESALRSHAYMQAVHETGARLTHDIKNLLQSIYALTSVAPRGGAEGYAGLLQRQLPQLAQRLHATLEKLRAPEIPTRELPVEAGAWWSAVERRLADDPVRLEPAIEGAVELPAALFDGFLENCLDNARAKRGREPGLEISVALVAGPAGASLRVCDTGTAIPETVARSLFHQPIAHARGEGLGIGLFQTARQAAQAGYRVALAANENGRVCFAIEREPAAPAAPSG